MSKQSGIKEQKSLFYFWHAQSQLDVSALLSKKDF